MVGVVVGVEDHHPVEQRQVARLGLGPALGPGLEMAAVLVRPILVQIDQHIHAPIEFQAFVVVEVGMDRQLPAARKRVEPATDQVGIGDEAFDAGHPFEKLYERLRVQAVDERPGEGGQLAFGACGPLDFPHVVERDAEPVRIGELLVDPAEDVDIEKVVEADVRVGATFQEDLGELLRLLNIAQFRVRQKIFERRAHHAPPSLVSVN